MVVAVFRLPCFSGVRLLIDYTGYYYSADWSFCYCSIAVIEAAIVFLLGGTRALRRASLFDIRASGVSEAWKAVALSSIRLSPSRVSPTEKQL